MDDSLREAEKVASTLADEGTPKVVIGASALAAHHDVRSTLSGVNSYSGATTITTGTHKLGAAGNGKNFALGTIVAGSSVASGGALELNGITLSTAEELSIIGTVSSTDGIDLRDGSVGSLTLGSTLGTNGAAGANNLIFDLGNATNTTDQIIVGGATSVANAQVVKLNQLGGLAGRNAVDQC